MAVAIISISYMDGYCSKQQYVRLPVHRRRSPSPWRRTPSLLRRCILVALLLIAVLSATTHIKYIRDQHTKQAPTNFAQFHRLSGLPAPEPPERPIRHNNGTHIDDRYALLRQLGSGQEGSAATYLDVLAQDTVVIKTFYNGNARNEIPAKLLPYFGPHTKSWPAAIEAGLLLNTNKSIDAEHSARYTPVTDFFVLEDLLNPGTEPHWCWAMVMPLASEGTLATLASKLRKSKQTLPQLDFAYRSQLNALLSSLDELHMMGYCHDDVKPDNIFIDNKSKAAVDGLDQVWMLGDVGTLRQVDHPWHKTYNWRRQGQWADCRVNDVRRLLKSYFAFLRAACEDQTTFDSIFINRQQNWARINSEFMSAESTGMGQGSSSAARALTLSQKLLPESPTNTVGHRSVPYARWMRKSVIKDLTCTTKSRWMDWENHS